MMSRELVQFKDSLDIWSKVKNLNSDSLNIPLSKDKITIN